MNRILKKIPIILIVFLLIAATVIYIYVYQPLWPGNKGPLSLSDPSYVDTGLFRINPRTILTALDEENTDVFLPDSRLLDDRYIGPILYDEPVLWSQSDNLKIVSELNNYVWKDDLDDWSLYRMVFNVDCQDSFSGLPGGIFTYFRTVSDKGQIVDIWREVEIDPQYAFVAWGGGAMYPHPPLGRESIDLSRLKITAEDAIKIAEENGGREARLRLQNRCSIHLSLVPQGFEGWMIDYGYSAGFEIQIEPYTGEVIK